MGMSSGSGTASTGAGTLTETVRPARRRADGRVGLPSTRMWPCAIRCWIRARLNWGRAAASQTSSRLPSSRAGTTSSCVSSPVTLEPPRARPSGRNGCFGDGLPAEAREEIARGEDDYHRDDLRRGEAPGATALGVAAEELEDEPGDRVEDRVGEHDLSAEALAGS